MRLCATVQDEYVGFMAPLAGDGLFVQPARRHPHRLGLFNASFGVWEQWKVLSVKSASGGDAHSVLVTLQPRRCVYMWCRRPLCVVPPPPKTPGVHSGVHSGVESPSSRVKKRSDSLREVF